MSINLEPSELKLGLWIDEQGNYYYLHTKEAYEAGAKAERERIAERQADAKECPPKYSKGRCFKLEGACKKCWIDWLEADE